MPAAPQPPRPTPPAAVLRGLDRVAARIRRLHLTGGLGRLAWLTLAVATGFYVLDRWLHLPVAVRSLLLVAGLALFGRELWRRVLRPWISGPDRLDAARIVEHARPALEGRLIAALQLGGGPEGSLEGRVAAEAAAAAEQVGTFDVLTARPALREVWWAGGALGAVLLLMLAGDPALGVFAARWTLHDVPWPRDTHLSLELAPRGPAHVLQDDGSLVAARGGVVDLRAILDGKRPEHVDLVIEGDGGERRTGMTFIDGGYRGHVGIEAGDRSLTVRGGDDPGDDARVRLAVVDPPRLDAPRFTLEPPAYLSAAGSLEVGPEDLVAAEGTRVVLHGPVVGEAVSGEVWMLASGERLPLDLVDGEDGGRQVRGAFEALASGTLAVVLTGPHGLATPDPAHHALVVQTDRPPQLRVFAPARSTVKVTDKAVIPFAVVAEDDHGIESVTLGWGEGEGATARPFDRDTRRDDHFRLLLDLTVEGTPDRATSAGAAPGNESAPGSSVASYSITATDGRALPGKGPQVARSDGRRVDVVQAAEVQRLLADRQLRLKEAYQSIRERQTKVSEIVGDFGELAPEAGDPDLVAVVVAQNQVTVRLEREARELAQVVDDTILNRLDPGPGADAVLRRRLDDWLAAPVDETFGVDAWKRLCADYAEGRFGRLDQVGRLLDMLAVALELSHELSPRAHELLGRLRAEPTPALLAQATAAQAEVELALDKLLGRMDEWEDFQEVLSLGKTLIEDQQRLRERTESALRDERESP